MHLFFFVHLFRGKVPKGSTQGVGSLRRRSSSRGVFLHSAPLGVRCTWLAGLAAMSQPKAKKKAFQATWAAPVILQGGGVQYSTANGTAIPPPKTVADPASQIASQPTPPPVSACKSSSLQWKNPQNGRGWHTGGYTLPQKGAGPAPPPASAQQGVQPVPAPLPALGQPPTAASTCKWAPTMTNGQPQKLKAAADHGGPTAAEKAAQRRAEQRARKAEERASKRMCTPGGLNSNFLGDLCSGLPFCTQSRDASHSRDGFQHDGGGSPNGAKRSKPKAPWSFGAERVQADSHSGGWAVPGTNWGFGGNGNGGGNSGGGGGGFNFTPPGWSPGSHATPGGGGGGFFGLGAPPQKSEDEAMIDDLLESQSKQEGDRGLWSLVTDLFNPGSHNNAPHGAPQQPPGEMSPYEVPPHQLPPPHQNGSAGGEVSGFSSTAADGSSFDDLVDMDVALGFEGVQLHADAAPNSAIPPSLSAASSAATTLDLPRYEKPLVEFSEHDRPAAPDFVQANGAEAESQPPPPTPLLQQPLPPHPHSLQANGGHAGAANLVGSDKSLDSVALMDLYEDATRQDYEEATRPTSNGGDQMSNGDASRAPPLPDAEGLLLVEGIDDMDVNSFTIDWRPPTPEAPPAPAAVSTASAQAVTL